MAGLCWSRALHPATEATETLDSQRGGIQCGRGAVLSNLVPGDEAKWCDKVCVWLMLIGTACGV